MLSMAVRFAIVGVSNSLFGLLVIYLAWRVWGWPDWSANAFGYSVGLAWGFALNRRWTFDSRGTVGRSLPRYLLVCAAAYAVNLVTVLAARRALGDGTFAPHVLGVAVYAVLGFLGSRYYAFRER